MATRGPKNGRRGLETGPPPDFLVLLSKSRLWRRGKKGKMGGGQTELPTTHANNEVTVATKSLP